MLNNRIFQLKCILCQKESEQKLYYLIGKKYLSTKEQLEWANIDTISKEVDKFIIDKDEFYLDYRPINEDIYKSVMGNTSYCSHCGFCAKDISVEEKWDNYYLTKFDYKNISQWIKTKYYRDIVNNNDIPDIAKRHMCISYINVKNGSFDSAAKNIMFASWICDDSYYNKLGDKCRQNFINLVLRQLLTHGTSRLFLNKDYSFQFVLIDTLRRIRQFDKSKSLIDGLNNEFARSNSSRDEEEYNSLIKFQSHLIDQQDSNRYSFTDLEEYERNNRSKNPQDFSNDHDNREELDWNELYFDAMTDGQYGDYSDFGDIDTLDDLTGH